MRGRVTWRRGRFEDPDDTRVLDAYCGRRVSKKTSDQDRRYVLDFLLATKRDRIAELTERDYQEYAAQRFDWRRPRTARRAECSIRGMARMAVKLGVLDQQIVPRYARTASPGIYIPHGRARIIEQLARMDTGSLMDRRDRLIALILCKARVSLVELCALRLGEVIDEDGLPQLMAPADSRHPERIELPWAVRLELAHYLALLPYTDLSKMLFPKMVVESAGQVLVAKDGRVGLTAAGMRKALRRRGLRASGLQLNYRGSLVYYGESQNEMQAVLRLTDRASMAQSFPAFAQARALERAAKRPLDAAIASLPVRPAEPSRLPRVEPKVVALPAHRADTPVAAPAQARRRSAS